MAAASDTSDSETEQLSIEDDSSLQPYQFEPTKSGSESEGETEDEVECAPVVVEKRTDPDIWCKCGNCSQKKTQIECICCVELESVKKMLDKYSLKCIIDHPSFEAVCLNKDVLWTALRSLEDRECAVVPKTQEETVDKTWRYAAYRQFIWWVYTHLGKHNRRVIPSCAVGRIRAQFEEEDGNYSTFVGDDQEASEILSAFKWFNVTST